MTDKYQAGESYADPVVTSTGLLEDLSAIGLASIHKDVSTMIKVLTTKGQPVDDREMTVCDS
jgi:hypothetical protein